MTNETKNEHPPEFTQEELIFMAICTMQVLADVFGDNSSAPVTVSMYLYQYAKDNFNTEKQISNLLKKVRALMSGQKLTMETILEIAKNV